MKSATEQKSGGGHRHLPAVDRVEAIPPACSANAAASSVERLTWRLSHAHRTLVGTATMPTISHRRCATQVVLTA
jgi:hypothetical protein